MGQRFAGFTPQTLDFLMAIRYNNNREYFQEHKPEYEEHVKRPLVELCEALGPAMLAIDPDMETRPTKSISRIYRDTRFSKNKSPYRDHMWMDFRRSGREKIETLGFFFCIYPDAWQMGMGLYGDNKVLMDALRQRIQARPSDIEDVLRAIEGFELQGDSYKRIAVPDGLPPLARGLYIKKGFWFEAKREVDDLVFSEALARSVALGFERLAPMYRMVLEAVGEWHADTHEEGSLCPKPGRD